MTASSLRSALRVFCVSFLLSIIPFQKSHSASLPVGFTETLVTGGLSSPTTMAFAPGSDERLFVAEQAGRIRIVDNGVLQATPFLTLNVDSTGERGLIGIAFDANWEINRYIYVYYTAKTPTIHNRVSRFTAAASMDVVVAGSEKVLLDLPTLGATNHNGGAIHHDIYDLKLYVAVGDNAVGANAQSLNSPFGKILRINTDGTIPSDNPFYNSTTGINRAIWAMGLRNPFNFAIRGGTGPLITNDVGAASWEEINLGAPGANYGWPATEGPTTDSRFKSPIHAYPHGTDNVCAITGGVFYIPDQRDFPSNYFDGYFFSDLCGGWIRVLNFRTGAVSNFASGVASPIDVKVAPDGTLYYLSRPPGGGSIYRINYTADEVARISSHPANVHVASGQQAVFRCGASGTLPIAYRWDRNGAEISGATSSTYSFTARYVDNGAKFRCRVSNAYGSAASNEALLTVNPDDAPVATIVVPASGTRFLPGETIVFRGTGTDPQDGNLPASAYTWRVDVHRGIQIQPFMQPRSGITTGSFTIPVAGDASRNVFYRIYLTVRDSAGAQTTVTRDVRAHALFVPEILEAEHAAVRTTGSAVGGDWALYHKGDVGDQFYFRTAGVYDFKIRARGTPMGGVWPNMQLVVDGVAGPSVFVKSGQTMEYTLQRFIDAGEHSIVIRYTNDNGAPPPAEDRNLYLDKMLVTAAAGEKFRITFNFQPAGVMVPVYTEPDTGLVYGPRANGLTYGWNIDVSRDARDRNTVIDQRQDTLIHMQKSGDANWGVKVPNGRYQVVLFAGDPSAQDSVLKINAEGVPIMDVTPTASERIHSNVITVDVTDGVLTLSNAPGAVNNKILFVDIYQL